jgi:hypothetical protein
MSFRRPLRPLAAATAFLLAACGVEGGDESAAEPDTAASLDGLSPEQIRAEAEALPPAVAESLGIVDTTIHLENLGPVDSLPAPPEEGTEQTPPDSQR